MNRSKRITGSFSPRRVAKEGGEISLSSDDCGESQKRVRNLVLPYPEISLLTFFCRHAPNEANEVEAIVLPVRDPAPAVHVAVENFSPSDAKEKTL